MPEWTEIKEIQTTPGLGFDLKISGNYLITTNDNDVFIYEKNTKGNDWELKYTNPNASISGYASSVSISGNHAISVNPLDTEKVITFYEKNNWGVWIISQTIPAIPENWGICYISGNYALVTVGAPAVGGEARVFEKNAKSHLWEQMQVLTNASANFAVGTQGQIAISGNYLAIADAHTAPGKVYLYQRNAKSHIWEPMYTLEGDGTSGGGDDFFGGCLDLSGNHLIVSAIGFSRDEQPLYIYQRNAKSKNWERVFGPWVPEHTTVPIYGQLTVAISGNFAMASQYGYGDLTNEGRLYYFQLKNDGDWHYIQTKTGESPERLGYWISISGNSSAASTENLTNDKVYIYDFKF